MTASFSKHFIPVWKEAPFMRFLIPFAAGIIFEWHISFPPPVIGSIGCCLLPILLFFYYSKYRTTYRLGIALNLLLFITGCWLTILKDGGRRHDHISRHYYDGETIIATLEEPLVTKPGSYKAVATVQLLDSAGNTRNVSGNIILYFAKDSAPSLLSYGNTIVFKRPLVPIKNAGNPGGFDYKRYAAFNGWYYQVYLKRGDYSIAGIKTYNRFQQLLYNTRIFVITIFQKHIPGTQETGLAEALLVGYKEDLDKSLVEQYANTGVVHIIAISGMHLGLIYGLLIILLKPLRNKKYGEIIHTVLIIAALWFFSLLTGAAPSITRSAIMFSVIVAGNAFMRRSSIYNSLALSAFILLLVNPFNLWDVGFQLSYAALLSIAILGKPIAGILQPENIILEKIWQLIAVTLAAQVFTIPFVLFHFHQFPLSFLLANLIAVPLSSLILYCLIALLVCSSIPIVATIIGWIAYYLIKGMNLYVAFVDALPFSKIESVNYTIVQALLLMLILAAFVWWWLRVNVNALIICLSVSLLLVILKQVQYFQISNQQKLVVYNVSRLSAIDIFKGDHYTFIGDTVLCQKGFAQNFNLLPTRIFYDANTGNNVLADATGISSLSLGTNNVLIVNKPVDWKQSNNVHADYVVLSNAANVYPYELLLHIQCKNIILDGSISNRSARQWKNAADSLHLRLHSVQEQGAFVMDF